MTGRAGYPHNKPIPFLRVDRDDWHELSCRAASCVTILQEILTWARRATARSRRFLRRFMKHVMMLMQYARNRSELKKWTRSVVEVGER